MKAAIAFASLGLLACAARQSQPASNAPLAVERYYPLRAGSVWTYDVDTGEGLPVLAIARVTSHEGSIVRVSSGSEPIVYELKPEGIFRPDRGAFLLKGPLTQGARWDAGDGVTAEISETDKSVTTVAGSFTGCIEVREQGGGAPKQVRTVFCPDVGPVEVESTMALVLTGKPARVLAKLRGYDFSAAVGQ